MTVDATLRSIYSAGDETVAELDRLLASRSTFSQEMRQRLDRAVAGLDNGTPEEIEVPVGRREGPGTDRRPSAPDPLPFVALPQRTTHGGPFGPAVRDKLTAEALAKRGW